MKRIAHKTALHALGWVFMLLGVIGCILPFLPGFAFFAVGIYFFSLASLWLWLKIETVRKRFPRLSLQFERIDTKVSKFIKKAHY